MVYHFNKVILSVYQYLHFKINFVGKNHANIQQFCIVLGSIATSLLHSNHVSAKFNLFSTFVLFWIVPLKVAGVGPRSYVN